MNPFKLTFPTIQELNLGQLLAADLIINEPEGTTEYDRYSNIAKLLDTGPNTIAYLTGTEMDAFKTRLNVLTSQIQATFQYELNEAVKDPNHCPVESFDMSDYLDKDELKELPFYKRWFRPNKLKYEVARTPKDLPSGILEMYLDLIKRDIIDKEKVILIERCTRHIPMIVACIAWADTKNVIVPQVGGGLGVNNELIEKKKLLVEEIPAITAIKLFCFFLLTSMPTWVYQGLMPSSIKEQISEINQSKQELNSLKNGDGEGTLKK